MNKTIRKMGAIITTMAITAVMQTTIWAATPSQVIYATGKPFTTALASPAAVAKATQVIQTIIVPTMTTAQKCLAVHDYIGNTTVYSDGVAAHTPDGPILYGYGMCDGYSSAFKCYMDLLGIPCQVVSSDYMDHAWDLVVVDGVPLEVDVTYDDYILYDGDVVVDHPLDHSMCLINSAQMIDQHIISDFGSLNADIVIGPDGSMSATWYE